MDPVESRREQNQLPKLTAKDKLQNHKVSPTADANLDDHDKMDSTMIDLNARPQRIHGQASNAQVCMRLLHLAFPVFVLADTSSG